VQETGHAEADAALQWLPELREEAAGQLSVHKLYFDPLRRPFADYTGPVELFRTAGECADTCVAQLHAKAWNSS